MSLLEVSKRPDRHTDLLNAAEAFGTRSLICFERGDPANIHRANELALAIEPALGGDIGWQVVDLGIILTRHAAALVPEAKAHLGKLLEQSLEPWKDREFGRGNVNHPVIATWLYAAAGKALGRRDYSELADERMRRFIHIFSQAGDMSEYNSPTYLGPTLVGLASIGAYAELESTRLRARLIEERIWLSTMARWHAPTQQLAGPHSRAYADSTLGFGGIIRYLAHAVLTAPVFWDFDMCVAYDHHYDAEWAGKIAACIFCFPDYLKNVAEAKSFPFEVCSTTDGEDYTVDGREVYRGGWSRLTTYMTPQYCLGSSERPYVDGGQTEMCIAYWKHHQPVSGFADLRALYFRYVANNRLPGQENSYSAWYGGRTMVYSPNLLHQDGRQNVLQHGGKAILLSQPLRRENGLYHSLRFDALIPIYQPLDEIWLADKELKSFPVQAGWDSPILLRDGDIFLALHPLQPTDLGGGQPEIEISETNHHLIISIYNLRGTEPRFFHSYQLNQAHNGLVIEIGTAAEYGSFEAFRKHIASARISEHAWLGEVRQIRYESGVDELEMHYNPETQEVLKTKVNGASLAYHGLQSPFAVQSDCGFLQVGEVSLHTDPGVPAWLAFEPESRWLAAALPTDQAGWMRIVTPGAIFECASLAGAIMHIHSGDGLDLELNALFLGAPVQVHGVHKINHVSLNGNEVIALPGAGEGNWVIQ
jgi:hypothetical protein